MLLMSPALLTSLRSYFKALISLSVGEEVSISDTIIKYVQIRVYTQHKALKVATHFIHPCCPCTVTEIFCIDG